METADPVGEITSHPAYNRYMETHHCDNRVDALLSDVKAAIYNKELTYVTTNGHYTWCPHSCAEFNPPVGCPCCCPCSFIERTVKRAVRILDDHNTCDSTPKTQA